MELQDRFERRRRSDARTNALLRKEWIQTQKKTFTNWMNDKLKETSYRIVNIETDLADGVALIKLLETFSHGKKIGRYRENPSSDIHKRENLEIVFRYMKEVEKMPLVNIGAEDIHKGNLKLILGVLWSIILRYQIADGEMKKRTNAKKRLLRWVNACLPENNIKNFSSDWNDGRNLSALVNYCKPGLIPNHASFDPHYRLENVTKAMDIAARVLGVPQVLYPEDLAVDNPDELSVMTYVSGFCCPNSPSQNSLLEWINKRIPNSPATNFTTDWSDGQRLGALIDSISGGEFPDADQLISNDSIRNCEKAMDAARYLLGIENTILPEDFADETLDQLTRMTYLTHFQHAKLTVRTDPSRCIASGLPNRKLRAFKTHSFNVSTHEAGLGELSASIRKLHGVNKCMIKEIGEGMYTVSFTPTDIATVHVEVLYDGLSIPGSPFEFTVNDPTKVMVNRTAIESGFYQVNRQPIDFRVSTKYAGEGKISASVLAPDGIENGIEMKDQGDQTYLMHYCPSNSGHHSIIIKFDGIEISDVPIQIFVEEGSKPQNVVVTQPTPTMNGLYFTEQPYSFQVNTVNAGKDTLTVTSRGTESDFEPNVSITENDNGTLTVMFVTAKPDAYMVSIQWGEEDVPGSPFTLHIEGKPRPEKVVCSGPHYEIGTSAPITLNINAVDAGVGKLEVTCMGNGVGVVPTETIEHAFEPRKYDISFVPPKPDVYAIEVKLDDQPVPSSPFIVNILQQCESVKVLDEDVDIFKKVLPFGKPASFRISTTDAGTGTLNITSRGPAKAEITTVDNQDSTCTCSFMPSIPGRYLMNVFWNDKHIKGSPYFLSFASNETVTIPGLEFQNETFKIGLPHKFKLHCAELREEGDLSIQCVPPSCAKIRVAQVPDSHSYQCEILPVEIGTHNIVVRYSEKLVLGSPFAVTFETRGDASKCHMIERSPEDQQEGTTFCISTEGAGKGKLTASVEKTSTKDTVPVSVTQISDDRYNLEFNPPSGAEYLLTVKYDEQHILGSPFSLMFEHSETSSAAGPEYETIGPPKSKSDPTACKVYGNGINTCIVGKTTMFVVDTVNAGPGKLTVAIIGDGEVLEPTILTLNSTQKEVHYVPTSQGKYTISVRWDDEEVPNSPFSVDCYPPLGSLFGSEQSLSRIFLGYL